MHGRTYLPLTWCALTLATGLLSYMSPLSMPAQAAVWQDEQGQKATIHLADGRKLDGVILKETDSYIVFEYQPEGLSFSAQMELQKSEIVKIDRHGAVATESAASPTESADLAESPSESSSDASQSSESVAQFYVIPIRGQMNTDIRSEVYSGIAEEIAASEKKPDVLIFKLNSEDKGETLRAKMMGDFDPMEAGMLNMDDSEALLRHFRVGPLRDIRQVLWIEDAVGTSSLLAMGWDEIYMMPEARLGGMIQVLMQSGAAGWADSQVRAKMMAAWLGHAKGHFEYGGQPMELADAMLDPRYYLTASWKGREVEWRLNKPGDYTVDGSDRATTQFTAEKAEQFCLSSGTADSLADLALLLNYREFEEFDGQAKTKVDSYIEGWRKVLEVSEDLWLEYQDLRNWATGADAMSYLAQARGVLLKILRNMKKYEAVQVRLARSIGITPGYLEDQIAIIDEQLKQMRQGGGGGARGGGAGYSGGGGGGRN